MGCCFLNHRSDGGFVVFVNDGLKVVDIVGGICEVRVVHIGVIREEKQFSSVGYGGPIILFVFCGDIGIWCEYLLKRIVSAMALKRHWRRGK